MSLEEFILCWLLFILTGLFTIRLVTITKITFVRSEVLFLPGFIVANVVSYLISGPGDKLIASEGLLLTDLPIFVGFPISYYRIGAWGDQFYPLAFIANILIVVTLGRLLQKHTHGQAVNDN